MKKLNWSCTTCGMSSSRRSSVQRHIDNYNIHNGIGQVVPFVEYSVGRREGRYWPQQAPQIKASNTPIAEKLADKILIEVENEVAKIIARRICSSPTTDFYYDKLEAIAKIRINNKTDNGFFRELGL
jgi:hypothetical protein